MIKLHISGEALLDLHVLHGEKAVDSYFEILKEEFRDQIARLKSSGAYKEHSDKLHH